MAHILFLEWNSFANEYMKRAWEKNGDTYVTFSFPTKDNTRYGEELTKNIAMKLLSERFDYLFSFNYFPVAAMAAKACRVRYISWVYDSPYAQLYSETIHYPTNDVRIFDRQQVLDLERQGVQTVSYLPMAADVAYYDSLLKDKSAKGYQTDISFVGSLYTEEKQQLYKRLENLSEYDRGYLDGLVQMQKQTYGSNLLQQMLSPELIARMERVAPLQSHPDAFATKAWYYANFYLYRKVTSLERSEILTMLAKKYDIKVYTHLQNSNIPPQLEKVISPEVDYYTQAPFVYRNSKINLNISLRSIGSGIPLRAFDIMGCGGFLLTNFQADFMEFFVPNEDFVYYTDYEDLLAKVDYYLTHDEERERVARNGYEKVKLYHTYEHRICKF